jgi:hypothetical protein
VAIVCHIFSRINTAPDCCMSDQRYFANVFSGFEPPKLAGGSRKYEMSSSRAKAASSSSSPRISPRSPTSRSPTSGGKGGKASHPKFNDNLAYSPVLDASQRKISHESPGEDSVRSSAIGSVLSILQRPGLVSPNSSPRTPFTPTRSIVSPHSARSRASSAGSTRATAAPTSYFRYHDAVTMNDDVKRLWSSNGRQTNKAQGRRPISAGIARKEAALTEVVSDLSVAEMDALASGPSESPSPRSNTASSTTPKRQASAGGAKKKGKKSLWERSVWTPHQPESYVSSSTPKPTRPMTAPHVRPAVYSAGLDPSLDRYFSTRAIYNPSQPGLDPSGRFRRARSDLEKSMRWHSQYRGQSPRASMQDDAARIPAKNRSAVVERDGLPAGALGTQDHISLAGRGTVDDWKCSYSKPGEGQYIPPSASFKGDANRPSLDASRQSSKLHYYSTIPATKNVRHGNSYNHNIAVPWGATKARPMN